MTTIPVTLLRDQHPPLTVNVYPGRMIIRLVIDGRHEGIGEEHYEYVDCHTAVYRRTVWP